MRARRVLVVAFAALWIAGLVARLVWLQVTRHEHYARKAAAQHQRVLDLEPPRGTIYDARGRVLAVSVEVDSVFAEPSRVVDRAATARQLARVLGLDAAELEQRLGQERDFVFVARKLDPPQASAVRELELPGIHFLRESKRYYPLRDLAAQVLGFVGTDHKGLAGLEAHYDRVVAGRPGRRTVLRDAHRRTLLSHRLSYVEAEPGADLHLTLDAVVQHVVERELAVAVAKHHARGGTAVVLDPRTGAVLALASVPSYDPNRFRDAAPARWRVPAVTDAFEPGSTFKLVTASAVLAHGVLTLDDVLDCEMGGITLAGVLIRDHHAFGRLTVRQVLAKSSNVGTIKLALQLGEVRLFEAVRAFGFGERTGVDLPGESPGIVRPLRSWSALSKAYVSFGQEVSVTPLQLARAVAAVANGGRLRRPYVVARMTGEEGEEDLAGPFDQGQAIPPGVAAQLADVLATVVAEGTGRQAAVEGYPVAGKTGTAQKVVGGRYSHRHFVASFVGFAPVGEPRLVGVVALDEPWPLYHGGQAAAPVFAAIARQVLPYWGVPAEQAPPRRVEPVPPLEPLPPAAPRLVRASLPARAPGAPAPPVFVDASPGADASPTVDTGEGPADPLDGPVDPLGRATTAEAFAADPLAEEPGVGGLGVGDPDEPRVAEPTVDEPRVGAPAGGAPPRGERQ
jgi:cell division protein FtsI (penicillin-binding protein 3)